MCARRVLIVAAAWLMVGTSCQRRPDAPAGGAQGADPSAAGSRYRKDAPDPGKWTVSLSGTWQFATAGSSDFQPAQVPGYWGATPQMKKVGWKEGLKWKTGTYRRSFDVGRAPRGAVVDFDMIRWGGEVLVNGRSAGKYDLGYSPVTLDVTGLIRPGANRLEVKPRGWAALERHEGKDIQIPVGAGNWFGVKDGGIPGEVYLRLYRGAWIDALRIVTRIKGPSCDVSTRVVAGPAAWAGRLAVQVVTADGRQAMSPVKRRDLTVKAGEAVAVRIKNVPAPGAALWWPEKPALYRLIAWLEPASGASPAAVRDDTFGFREVSVQGGQFRLNGRRMVLHGGTQLVMYSYMRLMGKPDLLRAVQADLFKRMHGTAFRSHVNPVARRLLDFCDRHGVMILPEFPNFPDVQRRGDFSPYELPLYWKNFQREIRGMIANRMNHPSIVAWVASNEGNGYGDWERANLEPFVRSVDPTRPVMLSADVTDDVADQHNFAGMWWGTHSDFEAAARALAEAYPRRLVGNTEYGQFGGGKAWYGNREVSRDSEEFRRDKALLWMEQTEALRRFRFGLIMPFTYGGCLGRAGTTGRYEDAAPTYHAMRNALSPLGVSLEFPRRHAAAGTRITVPIWVISDADDAKGRVTVRVRLLEKFPGFDWGGRAKGLKVLAGKTYSTTVGAWKTRRHRVRLRVPAGAGDYALTAAVWAGREPKARAISYRPLRVYPPLPAPKRARTVGVFETDGRIARWLERRGHRVILPYGGERPDVIVVGDGRLYDTRLSQYGFAIANRVGVGGSRLVVLAQGAWRAKDMQENMAQALDRVVTAPMRAAVEWLHPEPWAERLVGTYADYRRLNGVENIALRVPLLPSATAVRGGQTATAKLTDKAGPEGESAAETDNPWRPLISAFGSGGGPVDWALAARDYGKGQVLACQIPLTARLDRRDEDTYDPVAERLMALLIESGRIDLPEPKEK